MSIETTESELTTAPLDEALKVLTSGEGVISGNQIFVARRQQIAERGYTERSFRQVPITVLDVIVKKNGNALKLMAEYGDIRDGVTSITLNGERLFARSSQSYGTSSHEMLVNVELSQEYLDGLAGLLGKYSSGEFDDPEIARTKQSIKGAMSDILGS